MRKDFEAARYYYTGGREGYQTSERVHDNGFLSNSSEYRELKTYFDATEERLKEMEKAKGYEFVELRDNNIVFRDIKSGVVLSCDESNNI